MKFDFKPILKTILWIVFFLAAAGLLFALGLMIGYAVLGDGEPMQVFERETWDHILDYLR